MTNNKVYIFTYKEMDLIAEAFYAYWFADDPIDEEIVTLGKKIEAIPEDWTQE